MCFLIWWNIYIFIVWSIFLALGSAFNSGTHQAFFYDTLVWLDKEKEFTKLSGKTQWYVSLFSIVLMVSLPLLTTVNYKLPFVFSLFLDIVWLCVAFSLFDPPQKRETSSPKKLRVLFKEWKNKDFLSIALFTALIRWFLQHTVDFSWPYIVSLWYPVALIGILSWVSRLVWFLVSKYIHIIETKVTIKQFFLFDILFFTIMFALIAFLQNPYIISFFFAIVIWYQRGKESLVTKYLIDTMPNKNYKATMLSVYSQFGSIIDFCFTIGLWFVMWLWYKYGFYFVSASVLVFWWITFLCIKSYIKTRSIETA